jgi:menaquinone-9 beta-reductase
MRPMRKCEVLIAGAGPAGLATALYLIKSRPDLRGRVVALEKSSHPRFKTCAGGLIPRTRLALEELGIALDVPSVTVRSSQARTVVGDAIVRRDEPVGTVVRRDQFDALLARQARAAGLEIEEHCRVVEVEQRRGLVQVVTERGTFEARVLVGADGSGSAVRRNTFGRDKATIGRALMTDIEVDAEAAVEFAEQCYRFDFRCVGGGIKGYAWSFPCLVGGRPHLNVGIYDQDPRSPRGSGGEHAALLGELKRAFPELSLEHLHGRGANFHAAPIRWFNRRDRYAKGSVILAGDAAGVDPLMGEGISCAFEHGKAAAGAIGQFLDDDPVAFTRYDRALHRGVTGRKLRKLAFAARHFYGPHHRTFFRFSRLSRRAQELGLDWYNGARRTDELSTAVLVLRWTGSVLFGASVN